MKSSELTVNVHVRNRLFLRFTKAAFLLQTKVSRRGWTSDVTLLFFFYFLCIMYVMYIVQMYISNNVQCLFFISDISQSLNN